MSDFDEKRFNSDGELSDTPQGDAPRSDAAQYDAAAGGDSRYSPYTQPVHPEPVQNAEASGYRYAGGEVPHRAYVDANYQLKNEAYSENADAQAPKKPVKEKKSSGIGKIIAVALVCAILGGVGGGALVATRIPKQEQTAGDVNLSIADKDDSDSTVTPVASAEQLTGAQIYSLGCKQAVGVTSEITVQNFLGLQTKAAVAGSGFIVSEDGYIVTNYHVIKTAYEGGYKISIMVYGGETYDATVVGAEEENDIAVLKINATGLSPVTFEDSDSLVVGETVYCIGNPLGELNFSISSGIVSALGREVTTVDTSSGTPKYTTNTMFQIDAAINSGNSGGPVYNSKGQVVGMVTAKKAISGVEGLGFALPASDIIPIVSDIIENGYVTGKPSFGITVSTVDETAAQYYDMVVGAYVSVVNPGSCSEKAGLKKGDIVTKLNDTEIVSSAQFIESKRDYKAGDTVRLTVFRDGEYLEINVTLDEETPVNSVERPSGTDNEQQPPNQQSQQGLIDQFLQGLFQ